MSSGLHSHPGHAPGVERAGGIFPEAGVEFGAVFLHVNATGDAGQGANAESSTRGGRDPLRVQDCRGSEDHDSDGFEGIDLLVTYSHSKIEEVTEAIAGAVLELQW